jgi:hypothetical protein
LPFIPSLCFSLTFIDLTFEITIALDDFDLYSFYGQSANQTFIFLLSIYLWGQGGGARRFRRENSTTSLLKKGPEITLAKVISKLKHKPIKRYRVTSKTQYLLMPYI